MKNLAASIVLFAACCVWASAQSAREAESDLLGKLAVIERWSNYGPNSDYDKLAPANDEFKNALIGYAKLQSTLSYAFPRLVKKTYIATSRDRRLRIYSWDRETGGTMHDFDSVYQYRGTDGRVYSWTRDNDDDESGGAFFHDIFQLDSKQGPIYLAVSTFIGSTSLAGQAITAYTIKGSTLNTKPKLIQTREGLSNSIAFSYDFFSVVDRPDRPIRLFKFDPATRSFTFPVVIEDEKTPQGRVTSKFIRYRFNGSYFVKVS